MEFPQSVIEQVGYYVYALADPLDNKVFYVGKGTGNRVFAHAAAAIESTRETDKLETIRAIMARGEDVRYEIVRHGLTEDQAFEVESALVDWIGLPSLVNEVSGLGTEARGRMTAQEVIARYEAKPISISEPSLLIIINRLFKRNMSPAELYEATRGNWVLGPRRNKAKFAFSIYKGIVRQVYRIHKWLPSGARSPAQRIQARWRFEGSVAEELRHYVGGNVDTYLTRGAQSPVKYLNCQ